MRQHAGVFAANFSSNLLWQNCFAPKKSASCAEPRRVAAGILDVCQGGATMGLRQTRLLRRMFSYARRPNSRLPLRRSHRRSRTASAAVSTVLPRPSRKVSRYVHTFFHASAAKSDMPPLPLVPWKIPCFKNVAMAKKQSAGSARKPPPAPKEIYSTPLSAIKPAMVPSASQALIFSSTKAEKPEPFFVATPYSWGANCASIKERPGVL